MTEPLITNQNIELTQQDLQAERVKLHFHSSLLQCVGEAVIATDLNGKILYWNKGAERVYGWESNEVVGQNIIDVTPSDASSQQGMEIMAALQSGQSWRGEFEVRHRDGHHFHVMVTDTAMRDDSGKLSVIVGVSHDITAIKQLERELVSVAEERQRALGQELHDNLGQQLAAMGYQARALEKKILSAGDAESAKVAAAIAAQAQHAVMQCKQLAQGLLPFELESNGLASALRELASRIASSYGIVCHVACEDEIMVDDGSAALNLYRIAQEAINNAIRHGGAKHLTISLTLNKTVSVFPSATMVAALLVSIQSQIQSGWA